MKPNWMSLLLLIGLLGSAGSILAFGQGGDVAVVVNANNRVNNVTTAELRKIFAGEKRSWAGGTPVKLFVRGPGTRERTALLGLLGMSEGEYKQHWTSQVFRGEAQDQPAVLPSNGMQKEALAAFEGGIAFVTASDVKTGMKVLKVDGHLPGEPEYPFH
jgi:ABC-type phosphate transport system substrate-binding protein